MLKQFVRCYHNGQAVVPLSLRNFSYEISAVKREVIAMEVIEVIALLSLCIACIKLGMDIKKNQKKQPLRSTKSSDYFFSLNLGNGNRLTVAPFLCLSQHKRIILASFSTKQISITVHKLIKHLIYKKTPSDIHPTAPKFNGAGNRNRTHNLLITNQLLCQLSYASEITFLL